MKVLVLGGTKFLGRAVVDAGLADGHEMTLFNRGQTNPGLFPDLEQLRGDRDGGLSALAGRSFDAVVDPSGYVPRLVRASAEFLRGSVGHYVFVSSISVYETPIARGADESAPRKRLAEDTEVVDGETYGALKALCEDVVREVFAGAFTNVRGGLIAGPHDPSGRFTYWPVRLARGGRVLAPGDPGRQVQFVDVRDLAAWILEAAAGAVTGDFNATGPAEPLTMGELLETCRRVAVSDAELVWAPDAFLLEHDVGEWIELPLWLVEDESLLQLDVARAVAAGLLFRPLAQTVADTLAWAGDDPAALAGAGIAPEKEASLLAGLARG
jgi:2'-hydroxyisoflavone reductase